MGNITNIELFRPDGRLRYTPTLHWVELRASFPTAVFRDSSLRVIEGFTQYAIHMSERFWYEGKQDQAYISAMESLAYALNSLSKFLATNGAKWWQLNDDMLVAYRTYANDAIAESGKRKDELSSKRTVNVRMRQIYHAIVWLQEDALMAHGLIGEYECAVKSSLVRILKGERVQNEKELDKFPCLFRRVGEGSRMRGSVYWATQEDCDNLEEYFRRRYDDDLADRNILILYFMDHNALRRASAASLCASQFKDALNSENPAAHPRGFAIIPRKQKNQRQDHIEVDYPLLAAVARHIDGSRARIVAATGSKSDALFLSQNGKPLTVKAMTKIFREGMMAIGVMAHNSATHCIRRKSGDDASTNSIASRKAQGLPIGPNEVMADTSAHLSQGRYLSSQAYIKSVKKIVNESREAQLQRELHSKELEVARLRAELERTKDRYGAESYDRFQDAPVGLSPTKTKSRFRGGHSVRP